MQYLMRLIQYLTLLLTVNLSLSGSAFALEVREHLVNGGVHAVYFSTTSDTPEIRFYDKRVLISPEKNNSFTAYIGIPIGASIGTHTFVSYNIPADGIVATHTFTITDGKYDKQYITLTGNKKKYVDLNDAQLKRIRAESKDIIKAKQTWTNTLYAKTFAKPVEGIITGVYGSQRFFNNKPRRPHSGLDIANDTGTPIRAVANGEVILTGDFYFNGNTVVVNHGRGLLSLYVHLDTIGVEVGDMLTIGDTLGTMGETGRATGPHLHISMYLNEVAVDPTLFLPYSDNR